MTNSGELRRRKLKDSNERPSTRRKRKETQSSSIHRSLLCVIISGSILTGFVVLYTDSIPWHLGHIAIDRVASTFGHSEPVHAVVIDAGSTGSRVLAFSFHKSYLGEHLVLDKELFVEIKPGLSSYADTPAKGAASIGTLLDKAKNEIPEEYWNKTPLTLKATAGLRLLPEEKAENLLNEVRELFRKSPFLTDDSSVSIMDGTDEGIFSWFTVNFLLNRIYGAAAQTVAALDLGGGSTQVTFAALTPASLAQKEYIHKALAPQGEIPVYTHSYLGLGLMAARKEIITVGQPEKTTVTSECVNPIIKKQKYTYSGVNYLVSGLQEGYKTIKVDGSSTSVGEERPIVDFEKCSKIVGKYVNSKVKAPAELTTKHINAFSYYYDRATEVGLIDAAKGGRVLVKEFKNAAENACKEANADQPFMCLDLTFIWVLLEKGFGLSPETPLYLFKKINGHEISWALGAAYNILKK